MSDFSYLKTMFSYYTECQLATLERAQMNKRTSKYDLRRHKTIADGMVAICIQVGIDEEHIGRPRLTEALARHADEV